MTAMTFKLQDYDADLGIKTTVHGLEGKTVIEKSYDAEPLLELAAEMRSATEGERWGEMRHVGFIPMAELSKFFRQDGGFDSARCKAWIRENPRFATFSKVLK
jgi:hypothetical protein